MTEGRITCFVCNDKLPEGKTKYCSDDCKSTKHLQNQRDKAGRAGHDPLKVKRGQYLNYPSLEDDWGAPPKPPKKLSSVKKRKK